MSQDFADMTLRKMAAEVERMYTENKMNDKPKRFELSDIAQTRDDLIAHFDKQKELTIYHAEALQTAEYALVHECGWKSPASLTFGFDIFSGERTTLSREASLAWFENPERFEMSPAEKSDKTEVVALLIRGRTLVIRHWGDYANDAIRADTIHFPDGAEELGMKIQTLGNRWKQQVGWITE